MRRGSDTRGVVGGVLEAASCAGTAWSALQRVAQSRAKESSDQICKACHEPYFNTYAASKHGTKTDARAPAEPRAAASPATVQGALEHAAKGGGKGVGGVLSLSSKTVSADVKNGVCLTCHQGGKRIHWSTSTHAAAT